MKTLITTLIIFAAINLQAQEFGYYIVLRTDTIPVKIETKEIVEVYTVAALAIPENCINFEKLFDETLYFRYTTQKCDFYVEKKRINKRGKYKRIENWFWKKQN